VLASNAGHKLLSTGNRRPYFTMWYMAQLRWRLWKSRGIVVPLNLFFVRAGKKEHKVNAF
jgi:hypothetical protein